MKKIFIKIILIYIILLCSIISFAQDSVRITLDDILQNIDKSQIPTGFLDEYGAQFANLKTYNGVLTDSNVVNAMAWHYVYASIYSAHIYGTNTLPTPDSNYTVFNSEAISNTGVNPVSMLALNYSSMKPDAVDNNLFTISNDQLYDVAGRPESPYQLETVFAASPFYEVDNDGVLNLLFKQNLFINNTGKQVSSIQVNFDDGNGFVSAGWDSPISASYTDTGNKRLTFTLNFTDASSLQCYSNVYISNAFNGVYRYQATTVTVPFNPTNNNHSGGDVTVQYSVNNTTPTGNRQFQKPLIVVEGFDMHDAAPLLMEKGYDYESFRKEITDITFSVNGVVNTFNDNLDNIGNYDLIFLNYRDGTDDILRNAVLLEEVITWVNNNKAAGAEQNVVMGISMGGLVSRYCLADMTKGNRNPQTRLLITHDSPHRGANIPLGMQFLINDFANQRILGLRLRDWIPLIKQAVRLQLRPATMQQLIVRDNPNTRNLENNIFLEPNGVYRQMVTFQPTDPQPAYQFIATSQGSQCGIPVMQPYQQIAHATGDAAFSFTSLFFGAKYFGETTINALPNGTGPQRITYFNIKRRVKFFWINRTITVLNFEHFSPAGILGFDGAPAGTQPLSRGTGVGSMPPSHSASPWWLAGYLKYAINFDGLQLEPEFSFLPTVSALDEDNITAASLYAPHVGANYVPPANLTILQRYIAQEKQTISGINVFNIQHTNFTARNAEWIYDAMQNVAFNDCSVTCGDFSISGANNICNTPEHYIINNLSFGASVVWSTNNNIAQTDQAGNVTRQGNGITILTATITSCGSTTTVTKPITVGIPVISDIIGMDPSIYLSAGQYLTLHVDEDAPSYNWIIGGATVIGSSTSQYITVLLNQCFYNQHSNNVFSADVELTNSCGTGQYGEYTFARCDGDNGDPEPLRMSVTPNPVKDDLYVESNIDELIKAKKLSDKDKIVAKLYDITRATFVRQWTLTNGQKQHKLSVKGLNKGHYNLQITVGDHKVNKQIVIE